MLLKMQQHLILGGGKTILTVIVFFFLIHVSFAQSNPISAPLLKIEVASYIDGSVTETFDQQTLGSYIENSIGNMLRDQSAEAVSVSDMNVMYVLERGWRLLANGTVDGSTFLFSRSLLLENEVLYWSETGFDELCMSEICNNMQFVSPQSGGCACNDGSDVPKYLFRSSLR